MIEPNWEIWHGFASPGPHNKLSFWAGLLSPGHILSNHIILVILHAGYIHAKFAWTTAINHAYVEAGRQDAGRLVIRRQSAPGRSLGNTSPMANSVTTIWRQAVTWIGHKKSHERDGIRGHDTPQNIISGDAPRANRLAAKSEDRITEVMTCRAIFLTCSYFTYLESMQSILQKPISKPLQFFEQFLTQYRQRLWPGLDKRQLPSLYKSLFKPNSDPVTVWLRIKPNSLGVKRRGGSRDQWSLKKKPQGGGYWRKGSHKIRSPFPRR